MLTGFNCDAFSSRSEFVVPVNEMHYLEKEKSRLTHLGSCSYVSNLIFSLLFA